MPRKKQDNVRTAVSRACRRARESAGYTCDDVAALLGVSLRTVHYWEAGTHLPNLAQLCAMAQLSDVSMSTLLADLDHRPPTDAALTLRWVADELRRNVELARQAKQFKASNEALSLLESILKSDREPLEPKAPPPPGQSPKAEPDAESRAERRARFRAVLGGVTHPPGWAEEDLQR
jgi:transcriptional regulator with XRE-family HTH domain